jgi:hypothetical protein
MAGAVQIVVVEKAGETMDMRRKICLGEMALVQRSKVEGLVEVVDEWVGPRLPDLVANVCARPVGPGPSTLPASPALSRLVPTVVLAWPAINARFLLSCAGMARVR